MKLLIVSPLFPPDTTLSAKYVKELAGRLSSEGPPFGGAGSKGYLVTVLLYGHLPEKTPRVDYICVDKRQSNLRRVFDFTRKFIESAKQADFILLQNGPSVELPALVTSFLTKTPIIYIFSDEPALVRTKKNLFTKIIHKMLCRRCFSILSKENTIDWPVAKPIIHPLKSFPEQEMKQFESSWNKHLKVIEKSFK